MSCRNSTRTCSLVMCWGHYSDKQLPMRAAEEVPNTFVGETKPKM